MSGNPRKPTGNRFVSGRSLVQIRLGAPSGPKSAHQNVSRCMKQPTIVETIASRLLARQGIAVIWQLHLRASASHLDGNWLSATILIGIADDAERQWAGGAGPP